MPTREIVLTQTPAPDQRRVALRGDSVTVELHVRGATRAARCFVRTNVGRAHTQRRGVIDEVDAQRPRLGRDWHDHPMEACGKGLFRCVLPLTQIGSFAFKTYCIPKAGAPAHWPHGENSTIKVAPAHSAGANTVYTAFTRQFRKTDGPDQEPATNSELISRLDHAGYTVIPPSGTFRSLGKQLDTIIDGMGFRILQLLPIHPTPTTYARMGRYGSPFASLDFYAVDPALAEFDRHSTPMDQFTELVDAVHARSAFIYLDLPVNHTGWASQFQLHHPEWFVRHREEGFVSPGAWGVTWEDLSQLDYTVRELWREMAKVFLFWCHRGVDGFRCDAGYMVPAEAWEYIIARVRDQFPDTIFLLEGLGGDVKVVESLVGDKGLDWAYSEVFQNYTREQLENYLPHSLATSATLGNLVHFAETHDNSRLAAISPEYSRLRVLLCALTAPAGAFGITAGVEWFATEQIDVHGAPSLRWAAPENQVELIRHLNTMLATHPCFHHGAEIRVLHQTRHGDTVAIARTSPNGAEHLLVLANTDMNAAGDVTWASGDGPHTEACSLLDGRSIKLFHDGDIHGVRLGPGELLVIAQNPCPATRRQAYEGEPRVCLLQRSAALLQDLALHAQAGATTSEEAILRQLLRDPIESYRTLAGEAYVPIQRFVWPRDTHRTLTVMPNHLLFIEAPCRFDARLLDDERCVSSANSLPGGHLGHFAVLFPKSPKHAHLSVDLKLVAYTIEGVRHERTPICLLAPWEELTPDLVLTTPQVRSRHAAALLTNGRGGTAIARGAWGELESQYDALLSANIHPSVPIDRRVMLRRCRLWLRHGEVSRPIDVRSLRRFGLDEQGQPHWHFHVPVGMGHFAVINIHLSMARGSNQITLTIARGTVEQHRAELPDEETLTLIVRPDLEDRSCHESTQAIHGAEESFSHAVTPRANGFTFSPWESHALDIHTSKGTFHPDPEWTYQHAQPFEAGRGLAAATDIYSPGYFLCPLHAGKQISLDAEATPHTESTIGELTPQSESNPMLATIRRSICDFVVARDQLWTVIAGYPWFLDWGRDTLICLRGMVSAGFIKESRDILLQFASFESDGTLPNMIRGDDCSDRDTSDAPLWFFVACSDLLEATGPELLDATCGSRTLKEVLLAIAEGYLHGTPNGIRIDADSGLVYSPSHFTWMDTNYPAGTPRQGYPIEIQALWYAACSLLATITGDEQWTNHAERTASAVATYYPRPGGWLSDCLHADEAQPASESIPDDALRCNQLLAVTLGLIHEPTLMRSITDACAELIIPGGIRSLADRPVTHPLHVERDGVLLNDPYYPYWGHYEGDEDTRRKPAYHNGTGWSWVFPLYSEALATVYGAAGARSGLDLLGSSLLLLQSGCLGHITEVMDGNRPHWPRGCMAQAWGVTELYRVAHRLLAETATETALTHGAQ
jgi:starch synthase (maltosyl-transferring)